MQSKNLRRPRRHDDRSLHPLSKIREREKEEEEREKTLSVSWLRRETGDKHLGEMIRNNSGIGKDRIVNNWSAVLTTATASKVPRIVSRTTRGERCPSLPRQWRGQTTRHNQGTPCSASSLANKLLKGHPLQVTSEYYGKNECPVSRRVRTFHACIFVERKKKRDNDNEKSPISSRDYAIFARTPLLSSLSFSFLFLFFPFPSHPWKNVYQPWH